MDCLNPNCNITGNDRMISCWLCLGNFHLKCTALKARDADALLDPVKSLHWTCTSCKKINVEFYKFFKCHKDEFDQLNKDFLSVQSKLAKFGDLFNSFPNLDKFITNDSSNSPKRRRKATKLPLVPTLSNLSVPSPVNSVAAINTGCMPSTSLNAVSSQQLISPSVDSGSSNLTFSPNNLVTNGATTSLNAVLPQQLTSLSISNVSSNSNFSPNNINNNGSTVTDPIIYKPLQAVPPKRTIFVSRLASDTSTDDVDYYIKSKCGNNIDVFVQKFTFAVPRSISSFKISISSNNYDHVIDPNFWPENTLVRDYIYRDKTRTNRVGILPQRDPKN